MTESARTSPSGHQATIEAGIREHAAAHGLRAVLYQVIEDGVPLATGAIGESMPGIPATTEMHFRNGAVAIGYLSTLLLILADEGVLELDQPIAAWVPALPDAERVTPRMLISMTAGYPDFVPDDTFVARFLRDPFQAWSADELIDIGLRTLPRTFAPGTNWDYSHTNIVILGRVLETATGQPLDALLRQRVLAPLGLDGTVSARTSAIPEPVLHAFSSERRVALGIPTGVPFIEESTYWNPSWTLAPGSVQTTTIGDMTATAIAWGTGSLLSPGAHRAQITPLPAGFGAKVDGCRACHPLDEIYSYGLGLVISGDWMLQNPLFGGYGAAAAYLPSRKLAVGVATTFTEDAFDSAGDYRDGASATAVLQVIARCLDTQPPLMRPDR